MSKQETVEVIINVPKRLLDILEAENYFGWNKEDFWISAVKGQIGIAANCMEFDTMRRFYQKYGRNIDVVHLPKGFLY